MWCLFANSNYVGGGSKLGTDPSSSSFILSCSLFFFVATLVFYCIALIYPIVVSFNFGKYFFIHTGSFFLINWVMTNN